MGAVSPRSSIDRSGNWRFRPNRAPATPRPSRDRAPFLRRRGLYVMILPARRGLVAAAVERREFLAPLEQKPRLAAQQIAERRDPGLEFAGGDLPRGRRDGPLNGVPMRRGERFPIQSAGFTRRATIRVLRAVDDEPPCTGPRLGMGSVDGRRTAAAHSHGRRPVKVAARRRLTSAPRFGDRELRI